MSLLAVKQFLKCPTPAEWLALARDNLEILLVDHAKCEKKAASTALSLMFRYPERQQLQQKMAQLAREEVLHFEQVYQKIQERGYHYAILSPSRYAAGLRKQMATSEPWRLVDACIVGAMIEARSCERFAALMPVIEPTDPELSRYYRYLLRSESRHFEDYLALAREYAPESIEQRLEEFLQLEASLIEGEDEVFRFHSGIPRL